MEIPVENPDVNQCITEEAHHMETNNVDNKSNIMTNMIEEGFDLSANLTTSIIDFLDDLGHVDELNLDTIVIAKDEKSILYNQVCPYIICCNYSSRNAKDKDSCIVLYPLSGKVKLYHEDKKTALNAIPDDIKLSIQIELSSKITSSTESNNKSPTDAPDETEQSNLDISSDLTEKIIEFNKELLQKHDKHDVSTLIKITKTKDKSKDKYGVESPFIILCTYSGQDKANFNIHIYPLSGQAHIINKDNTLKYHLSDDLRSIIHTEIVPNISDSLQKQLKTFIVEQLHIRGEHNTIQWFQTELYKDKDTIDYDKECPHIIIAKCSDTCNNQYKINIFPLSTKVTLYDTNEKTYIAMDTLSENIAMKSQKELIKLNKSIYVADIFPGKTASTVKLTNNLITKIDEYNVKRLENLGHQKTLGKSKMEVFNYNDNTICSKDCPYVILCSYSTKCFSCGMKSFEVWIHPSRTKWIYKCHNTECEKNNISRCIPDETLLDDLTSELDDKTISKTSDDATHWMPSLADASPEVRDLFACSPSFRFEDEIIEDDRMPTKPLKQTALQCAILLDTIDKASIYVHKHPKSEVYLDEHGIMTQQLLFKPNFDTKNEKDCRCCVNKIEHRDNSNFYLIVKENRIFYHCLHKKCNNVAFFAFLDETILPINTNQIIRNTMFELCKKQGTKQFSTLTQCLPSMQNFRYSTDHQKWYTVTNGNGIWVEQNPKDSMSIIQSEIENICLQAQQCFPDTKPISQGLQKIEERASGNDFMMTVLKNCESGKLFQEKKLLSKFASSNPYIFAFSDGKVFDLKQKHFREARYDDYIHRHCGWSMEYDSLDDIPDNPEFNDFMRKILPDEEEYLYIQQLHGNLLHGEMVFQGIPFFVGEGANGKTKLLNLSQKTLTGNATNQFGYSQPGEESFLYSNNKNKSANDHNTNLAEMKDVRVIVYEELPPDVDMNQDVMKKLTGGGKVIKARRCHASSSDVFEFICKWVIGCNKVPHFNNLDVGMLRRLVIALFRSKFVTTQEDYDKYVGLGYEHVYWAIENIDEKFDSWRPQMFKWMVEGFKLYEKHQLKNIPESFKIAKQLTIDSANPEMEQINEFLEEGYIVKSNDVNACITLVNLYPVYEHWCEINNICRKEILSKTRFKDLISVKISKCCEQKRIPSKSVKLNNVWLGYLFTDQIEDDDSIYVFKHAIRTIL